MEEVKQDEKMIEVDGSLIPLHLFHEMTTNPKIQLREIEPGKWKTFQRLYS